MGLTDTVALVGYGYWGPNLLRNYMEHAPMATVKWVCDLRPAVLDRAASAAIPTVRTTTESVDDVLGIPTSMPC